MIQCIHATRSIFEILRLLAAAAESSSWKAFKNTSVSCSQHSRTTGAGGSSRSSSSTRNSGRSWPQEGWTDNALFWRGVLGGTAEQNFAPANRNLHLQPIFVECLAQNRHSKFAPAKRNLHLRFFDPLRPPSKRPSSSPCYRKRHLHPPGLRVSSTSFGSPSIVPHVHRINVNP